MNNKSKSSHKAWRTSKDCRPVNALSGGNLKSSQVSWWYAGVEPKPGMHNEYQLSKEKGRIVRE